MAGQGKPDTSPDLTEGVTLADFGGRKMLRGRVGKKPVLLALVGDEVHAIGATCTHYQGRLDRGALEGEAVRCPLHHALFQLIRQHHHGLFLNLRPAHDPIGEPGIFRQSDQIRIGIRQHTDPELAHDRAEVM